MSVRSLRASVVAAVAAVALLVGCGTPEKVTAPALTFGGDPGESCVPFSGARKMMLIGEVVTATAAVAVIDAQLENAAGVRVLDSFILPLDGTAVGTSDDPPDDVATWKEKVPAAGSELSPGVSYNLVLRVERTSGTTAGTAEAITVRYRSGADDADVTGSTRYRFDARCF